MDIKFRGKTKGGDWVYGYYFVVDTTDYQDEKCNPRNKGYYIYAVSKSIEVIPETVGQYVGREDRYGKEIYAGDKVKDKYGNIWDIYYNKYESCWYGEDKDRGLIYALFKFVKSSEVIGTIHD